MIVDQKVNKQFKGVYLIDGVIDGTQLGTTSKPNGFRRAMTNLFLGWNWISIKKLKELQEKELKKQQEAKAKQDALKAEQEAALKDLKKQEKAKTKKKAN